MTAELHCVVTLLCPRGAIGSEDANPKTPNLNNNTTRRNRDQTVSEV